MTTHEKVMAFADLLLSDMEDHAPSLMGRLWRKLAFELQHKMPYRDIPLASDETIPDEALLEFVLKVGEGGLLFYNFKGIGPVSAKQLFREAQEIAAAREGGK